MPKLPWLHLAPDTAIARVEPLLTLTARRDLVAYSCKVESLGTVVQEYSFATLEAAQTAAEAVAWRLVVEALGML